MRAGHRRQAGQPTARAAAHKVAPGFVLALLAAAGCLNLDLPAVPTTPPAPELSVLTPRQGDTLSLSGQVSVTAASVNGIGRVNVLCGQLDAGARTVYSWASPPYLAIVDFALCQDLVLPGPPDAGLPLLPLTVQAISDAGASQYESLDVFFNTAAPILTVVYPPSAQPKSPFSVQVSSNTALKSFPSVALDNIQADSVTALVTTPDGGTYLAFFASTSGLGTDNAAYTPNVPVPIEVLTDTERLVRLTVSATASNGNTTQEDLSVDLTRVVWDRYIPGLPASNSAADWAAQPVAYAGGLVLPLATAAPASSASNWLPGRLESADGTFDGFDATNPALLPGGLDGGYVATGLSNQGATLFAQVQGRFSALLLAPPPPLTAPIVTVTRPGQVTPPLTAVDDLLCLQDTVPACATGTFDDLACLDPSLAVVVATSGTGSTGPPTPGVVAGAGGRYLSPNVAVCGSSWNLADLAAGTITFGPLQDPNLDAGSCSIAAVTKLVAVGDGTFVVQLSSNCIATAAAPPAISILRVGADSTILGAYTSPFGSPSPIPRELVGALVDGRVVTLRNTPPYTLFELWTLNSATPDVSTPIAGLFDSADSTVGAVVARSTYAGNDGSFAVLLSGGTFGAAVAAFGSNLQPLWLYLYPRITDATSARLVSASTLHDVYLVDQLNNRAVSVRLKQQPASDAGSGNSGAGIYVSQANNSVLVFAPNASGNAAPVRTLSGSQTGLSLPIGMGTDAAGNLYVANRQGAGVTVYAPGAAGNTAPLRTLTASGMNSAQGVAVGTGGDVYVSTCPSCGPSGGGALSVFHFPAQVTTSDYSITGSNTELTYPAAIALGDVNANGTQPLYVENAFGGLTLTFAPGASGNAAPTSSFLYSDEANVQGMAYASNSLFLSVPSPAGIVIFPVTATGNATPASTLAASASFPLSYPGGVAVDSTVSPPVVYVVDFTANAIYALQTTGVPPNLSIASVTTISGTATGLNGPVSIYLAK